MSTRAGAVVYVTADVDGLIRNLREGEGAVDKFADRASSDMKRVDRAADQTARGMKKSTVAMGAALGSFAGLAGYQAFQSAMRGISNGVRTGWEEMKEQQAVSAQTAVALKNLGKQNTVTQAQVEGLAGSLQSLTGYQDDQIQSAENMLLITGRLSGDVLPRATRATTDLARAMNKDLVGTSRALGRALGDPITGLGGLSRVGIRFTKDQKEMVKAWVEQGDVAKAQAFILAEVEKRTKGAAEAYGKTLPGAIDRAKRRWEDFSENAVKKAVESWPAIQKQIDKFSKWFNQEVMPDIRATINNISAFWEEHREDIKRVWNTIKTIVRTAVQNLASTMKIITSLLRGDWGAAWDEAKEMVRRTLSAIVTAVRNLGTVLWNAAKAAGRKLGEGLISGLRSIPGSGALLRALGIDSGPSAADIARTLTSQGRQQNGGAQSSGGATARAMGGYINGPSGVDRVPVWATRGEVILNETQQSILGRDAINQVLARTGGVLGGSRFATGGWVYPAPGTERGGGPGGGTHSYSEGGFRWQDDYAWDLMGKGGQAVRAAYSGTVGTYMTPPGNGPRYAGYGVYLNVPGGQLWYRHIKPAVRGGQEVAAGDVIGYMVPETQGGPHLHFAASNLSLLSRAMAGSVTIAAGGTARRVESGGDGLEKPDPFVPAGRAPRRGSVSVGGYDATKFSAADLKLLTSGGGPIGGLTDRNTTAREALRERNIGNEAKARARAAGVSNEDKLRDIAANAVNQARLIELKQEHQALGNARARLQVRIEKLSAGLASWTNRLANARNNDQRAQARERIRDILAARREEYQNLAGIMDRMAENGAEQELLGGEIADLQVTINSTPNAGDSGGGGGAEDPAAAGPSYTDTIMANTAMLNSEWLRTALGAGDIGTGGGTALGAAMGGGRFVTIRVETTSLAGAVASASGDQGYISAAVIPAGV